MIYHWRSKRGKILWEMILFKRLSIAFFAVIISRNKREILWEWQFVIISFFAVVNLSGPLSWLKSYHWRKKQGKFCGGWIRQMFWKLVSSSFLTVIISFKKQEGEIFGGQMPWKFVSTSFFTVIIQGEFFYWSRPKSSIKVWNWSRSLEKNYW